MNKTKTSVPTNLPESQTAADSRCAGTIRWLVVEIAVNGFNDTTKRLRGKFDHLPVGIKKGSSLHERFRWIRLDDVARYPEFI
jgi:hypothetical protein